MAVSSVLSLVTGHVKLAAAVAATAAITGGGAAVSAAVTADKPHAAHGHAKAAQAGTADVDLPPCPAHVKNHGAYVSSIAKTKPGADAAPNAHGQLVSAAARSDCGKPEGGGNDETGKPTHKQRD